MIHLKRLFFLFLTITIFAPELIGQDFLYKQGPVNQPLSVIKRLSYENFRNIKLLQTAIINYGGGEGEIDKLIDQYADASALYFQNQIDLSAEKFLENEREILNAAKNVIKIFRADSEKMLNESIKTNVRAKLKLSGKDQYKSEYYDKHMSAARYAMTRANDQFDRFINAKQAPPRELFNGIFYYRRVKENVIQMEELIETHEAERETANKDRKEKTDRIKEIQAQIAKKYEKDIADNNNTVYRTREKTN